VSGFRKATRDPQRGTWSPQLASGFVGFSLIAGDARHGAREGGVAGVTDTLLLAGDVLGLDGLLPRATVLSGALGDHPLQAFDPAGLPFPATPAAPTSRNNSRWLYRLVSLALTRRATRAAGSSLARNCITSAVRFAARNDDVRYLDVPHGFCGPLAYSSDG